MESDYNTLNENNKTQVNANPETFVSQQSTMTKQNSNKTYEVAYSNSSPPVYI